MLRSTCEGSGLGRPLTPITNEGRVGVRAYAGWSARLHQGINEFIGPVERGVAEGLAVRQDHGPQYMSHHFQNELKFLGIRSSPSYVAQPEGNGVAERFVRTL